MDQFTQPLISCVCITEKRIDHLKKSVSCFMHQTYANKELVVVHQEDDEATINYISQLQIPEIRLCALPHYSADLTLGEKRNFSIAQAHGEYFCQWDDDDWYHNSRLEYQLNAALSLHRDGSVLTQIIFFDKTNNKAFLSFSRPWENTIFCKRSIVDEGFIYQKLNRTEDTALVKELLQFNKLGPVTSFPLYIYVQHGNNTTSADHFEDLYSMSQELSPSLSNSINEIVEGTIPNDEASELLISSGVQQELNYFHIPKQLLEYI